MSTSGRAQRLEHIPAVLHDPPDVHEGAPDGVWKAAEACYAFIAEHLPEDATTLETGLGMSTVLFARWSAQHVCVVGSGDQVDRLQAYAAERGLDYSNVRFEIGSSDLVLPSVDIDPIDLYLIDGGHGFPHPAIDWYYGSLLLRDGGIVVIDDIQLPAVHDYLITYLEKDPRWEALAGDHKWRAFRKQGDFSVREEWTEQRFLGEARVPLINRAKIAIYRQLQKRKPS